MLVWGSPLLLRSDWVLRVSNSTNISMGEWGRREGRCSHHLSTYHLLTYPSFHIFLVLVLRPYLYLLHDGLIPTPYASLRWDSPPSSGLSWEWGNGSALPSSFYATLRSGHFLDEAMLGPFWHTPDRHFPWDFWYQRPWTKKTKDDSSALRFCRIVWPSQRSAWEHQDTSHVSLLPESPLLPPTSLSLILLIPHPHRPRLMEFFWQICLGWQRGVRVRRRSNLGDPLFLEFKSQDSEKRKPGEDSFFLLLSVNIYFSWSISRECPRLRVKVRSKFRKYQEGTSINIVQIFFLIH